MPISNRLNSYLNLLDTLDSQTQSLTLSQNNQPVVEKTSFIVNFIRWFIRIISCHHIIVNPKLDSVTRRILDVAQTEETILDINERKRVLENLKKLKIIIVKNGGSELHALEAVIQKVRGIQKLVNPAQDIQATVEDIPNLEKKLNKDDPSYNQKLEELAFLCEKGIENDPSLALKAVNYSIELAERLSKESKNLAASHHYTRALKICRKQDDLKDKVRNIEETLLPIYDSLLIYYFNIFYTKKTLEEMRQDPSEILRILKDVIENTFSIPGSMTSQHLLNATAFADTFSELYEEGNPFVSKLKELYKKSIEAWETEVMPDFEKFCQMEEKQSDFFANLYNRLAFRYVIEAIEQKKINIQTSNTFLEKALALSPSCHEARKILFENYMSMLEPPTNFWSWETIGKVANFLTGKDVATCEKAFELMPDVYGKHIPKLIEHYAHKNNPKALELKLKWPDTPVSPSTVDQLKKLALVKKIEYALNENDIETAESLFEPAKSFAQGTDLDLLKLPFANHYEKILKQKEPLIYIPHKMTLEELKDHVVKNRSTFIDLLDAYNNLLKLYPQKGTYYFQKAQLVDFFALKDIPELAEKFRLTSKTALECYEMAIRFKRNHFYVMSYKQCLSDYNKHNNTLLLPSNYFSNIPYPDIKPEQQQVLDLWMRDRFIAEIDYSQADLV